MQGLFSVQLGKKYVQNQMPLPQRAPGWILISLSGSLGMVESREIEATTGSDVSTTEGIPLLMPIALVPKQLWPLGFRHDVYGIDMMAKKNLILSHADTVFRGHYPSVSR